MSRLALSSRRPVHGRARCVNTVYSSLNSVLTANRLVRIPFTAMSGWRAWPPGSSRTSSRVPRTAGASCWTADASTTRPFHCAHLTSRYAAVLLLQRLESRFPAISGLCMSKCNASAPLRARTVSRARHLGRPPRRTPRRHRPRHIRRRDRAVTLRTSPTSASPAHRHRTRLPRRSRRSQS